MRYNGRVNPREAKSVARQKYSESKLIDGLSGLWKIKVICFIKTL